MCVCGAAQVPHRLSPGALEIRFPMRPHPVARYDPGPAAGDPAQPQVGGRKREEEEVRCIVDAALPCRAAVA